MPVLVNENEPSGDAPGRIAAPNFGRPQDAALDGQLSVELANFLEAWPKAMAQGWNAAAAEALHEDIERIAASADLNGDRAVAAAALEFTVFLCSFIEEGKEPGAGHRIRLDRLVEGLRNAAQVSKALTWPTRQLEVAASLAPRSVVYLRATQSTQTQLGAKLGQHGYLVHACEQVEEAVAQIMAQAPDALVMDDAYLAHLHALIAASERSDGRGLSGCPCLVLAEVDDLSHRLAVQRAGATYVPPPIDSVSVVERLDKMLLNEARRSYRVLVVDDDRSQALFCDAILRHKGMTTHVVASAQSALSAAGEFRPDLVLMDLHLPGLNGIEATQLLRERPDMAVVPIIFLSGERDLEQRFDAIRMGGDDFLTKPIKPRHLIGAVTSRVRRARALQVENALAANNVALAARASFIHALELAQADLTSSLYVLLRIAVDESVELAAQIGFVAAETLAQQLGAFLATESALKSAVCCDSELAYLMLVRATDTDALRRSVESLQARVVARCWLCADRPLDLRISIAGLRAGDKRHTPDQLIARVRTKCLALQTIGAGQFDVDLER